MLAREEYYKDLHWANREMKYVVSSAPRRPRRRPSPALSRTTVSSLTSTVLDLTQATSGWTPYFTFPSVLRRTATPVTSSVGRGP